MLQTILNADWGLWFAALFALSEAIGMLPVTWVKSSGVFQAIYNGLKWLKDTVKPKPPADGV
jgi:hypothetical protein